MTKEKEKSVVVAGITLKCVVRNKNQKNESAPSFIYTKDSTPYNNLQQLALAVSCYRPVLLQGPVGSGKTSTVEYLAYVTGHKLPSNTEDGGDSLFLKIQLGEQTDARMLLGGYQCTEIPGEFVWKPGVLTQAVIKGHWLLLEDIDCTSSDVVTVIDNLVKTQSLCVPGYSDNIIPHSQFQLFATQRTLRQEFGSGVKSNVLKHWITIQLNPLSKNEIVSIINEKFPKLSSIASRMVTVLDLDYSANQVNSRVPSVRDILKWCNRSHNYFKDGSPEGALRIFHDAVDIFSGFMDKDLRLNIATQIGVKLGIVRNKANFMNSSYKPNIMITTEKFIAGRSSLKRRDDSIAVINRVKKNVFSLTTQSCCLLEKISCCLEFNEPVLLVGETGCGKTTVLQYIAKTLGRNLVVINMNQQSDTADLVGGFKPVTFKLIMKPLCDKFETLFRNLFDVEKNADCLMKFSRLVKKQNWDVLINFVIHVQKKALAHINKKLLNGKGPEDMDMDVDDFDLSKWEQRLKDWEEIGVMIEKYSKQRQAAEKSLVFSFIEGSLVTAMKKGHWILLDEINLANSETLDCLSGLLEDSRGSISLLEKGESRPVYRDSGFRLFAAMNPATDVGKKQLPMGLRNRFTEIYIDELENSNDLLPLVDTYLCELNLSPAKLMKIVKFYLKIKKESKTLLLDGNGRKPHYSLRNLCRALTITAKNACGNVPRSLYEGLSVSFLTQLDSKSYSIVNELIVKTVTDSDVKSLLNQPIPKPSESGHINIEGFWLPVGSLQPTSPDNYILTPTVKRHFRDLIKIVSLGSGLPVLLEGDTSVGKTSLINYLAKRTGNVCSRVNNHEHTDIQEYIGTYVADAHGKLVFKEGILCESMRKGHWLILDELNLAPTEVLEALNRVLDDNRELFIPETQTTIKAHEKFLLFATQNPPGLYGGRKELSRAFRNRFIELQFNQIPPNELVTILEKRCQMPLSYCNKMVNTMTDLQLRRRGSDIFVGKSGFITLRDLFRWGERYQKAKVDAKFHDWDQHIADEGYILLAGRVRLPEESKVIEEVICKYFKRKTSPDNLFSLHENTSEVSRNILEKLMNHSNDDKDFKHIVWTYSMRRLAVLVCKALDFSEPTLIVGETGCGKTSVVQLLARLRQQALYSVNCHMHSESADFLGGLRPVRSEERSSGKFFEWCDGPLVQAMTSGSFFLADEISLADDSVLERLNSLLEPERTILLAEKGGGLIENENEEYVTVADKNFQFIGTMNPGGDYGKKELSPALRNRFTEIWADVTINKFECYFEIIKHNLNLPTELRFRVSEMMTKFLKWFKETEVGKKMTLSVRDLLTWVNFMNSSDLEWFESCVHGVCLTFLDGLGSGTGFVGDFKYIKSFKDQCVGFLINEMSQIEPNKLDEDLCRKVFESVGEFYMDEQKVGIHPFYIKKGRWDVEENNFVFSAPTTFANAKRLLRGLKMNKAILLEGSPGVGKTSLVSSLAKASGFKLARINLSDQTDISDLFGADLPEEGGSAGHFVWRDGPFLTALKEGQWILLDELNLASQSVLEGLNAVLDHRGSVFIPELNKTFYVSTETKLFACQNPLKEGGNRRGLPKSFLNRFTQVYVEPLTEHDYIVILNKMFADLSALKIKGEYVINQMIKFNAKMCEEITEGRLGVIGGPWELNLRDITRWAEGVVKQINTKQISYREDILSRALFKHMNLLYVNRFRTREDREKVRQIYETFFGEIEKLDGKCQVYIEKTALVLGENVTSVNNNFFYGDLNEFGMLANLDNVYDTVKKKEKAEISKLCSSYRGKRKMEDLRLLEKQYPVLSSLCQCVNMNWLAILVGESGTGKTDSIRTFAALKGENLRIMSCNSAMDTTEILGGFEQTDYNRHLDNIAESGRIIVLSAARRYLEQGRDEISLILLKKWMEFKQLPLNNDSLSAATGFEAFLNRVDFLQNLLELKEIKKEKDLREWSKGLVGELENLKKILSTSDCLTFGGKFEWVDSILVKSLKDGSWLLIEDVNLCSNAVLDRLNCLLEPNGCLTIGERGAGSDGNLVTITPHPNFRLFFTMDPKNGSISRAMRNRGVEIYLLPNEEINHWPRLDLISLLADSRISNTAAQKALIELESSSDNQNISNIISNAFWTGQYIRHGFEKSEAFVKSSRLIYKHLDSPDAIEELSKTIKENTEFITCFLRPPLNVFLVDPRFARLKQSFSLLNLISEVHERKSDLPEVVKHFFNYTKFCDGLKAEEMMKLNVYHIYLTNSGDVLREYFEKFNKDWERMKMKETLAEIVRRLSTALPVSNLNDLPWDGRWFENVTLFFGSCPNEDANKILLLMKYLLESPPERSYENSKSITVAKYSKSVEEGRVEDSFPNEPIVSNFLRILREFDELTVETLKCSCVKVTEEEALWFLNAMKWRFRLGNQGKLVLLSGGTKKTLNEDTLTLLELHLSWFLDVIIKKVGESAFPVFKTLSETLQRKYTKFWELTKNVASPQNSLKLIKISNIFRNSFGNPSPKKYLETEKNLEDEMTAMEITETSNVNGDYTILRSILNTLLEYVNLKVNAIVFEGDASNGKTLSISKFLTLLEMMKKDVKFGSELKNVLEEFRSVNLKEKQKLTSEVIFYSLKILNSDYEFSEEINETSEFVYLRQILPFHRAVWTSRILSIVFDSEGKWGLSNFQKSQKELFNLTLTLLPNINLPLNKVSETSLIDSRYIEQFRLSLEINRVIKMVKKSLGVEAGGRGLKEVLKEMAERSSFGVEKIFFSRLDAITSSLVGLKLSKESGFEVVGCFWTLVGLLELLVLREGKIDPIRKKLIKSEYAATEVKELESEIIALDLYSAITGISLNHFYAKNLRNQLEISRKNVSKYKNLEEVKRSPDAFREFSKEMESFMTTFEEIFRLCENSLEKVFQNSDTNFTQHLFRKIRFILLRNKQFSETMKSKFVRDFGDLAFPVLAASAQIEHGLNIIMSEILRLPYSKQNEVTSLVSELCRFPVVPNVHIISKFQKLSISAWPGEALKKIDRNKLLILFSFCIVKYNEWLYFKNESSYDELMGVFSKVVEYWKKEEERKKKEEMEKESLYLKKGMEKCKTIPEEEEFLQEQLKLFPTFEEDFKEENISREESNVNLGKFTDDHLSQVSKMHMKIVKEFMKTSWFSVQDSNLKPDLVSPVRMRFVLLSQILPNISYLLDYKADQLLLPGLLVLINCKQCGNCSTEVQLTVENDQAYDFYRDKNVEEVNKCLEILLDLKTKLKSLLAEWPDHPTLVQLNVLIERILTFSIESPIMRFLTGLEYLLQNCQHWESVAHSGVSVAEHLIKITNLIISWRKLELQGWKNCLQAAHNRIKRNAFKWWFHFWCLVEEYLTKEENLTESRSSLNELLKALYNFIETSPIGEFETRLEILLSYHFHVLHLPKTKKRDILAISLWNLYAFYQQFNDDVSKKLKDESAPVFKKLKEFVGIAKWHDITYWSVKQAIDKSHRTLLKYIKEYEVVLKQKVELMAFDPTRRDESKTKGNTPNLDVSKYLKNIISSQDVELVRKIPEDIFSIRNLDRKLEKARKFSNDVVLTAEYPNLIIGLEELIVNICESSQHFAGLDVDRSLPKEKQKSQAKNIVQQKRRALADLFKTLQRIGLSYRAGINENEFGILDLCNSPPLNFSEGNKSSGKALTGEEYYFKTVFRKQVLENSLLTPSKEIGPQIIERLKGFSGHLLDLNKKQKTTLCEVSFALQQLQNFESTLVSLTKSEESVILNQKQFAEEIYNFKSILSETSYVLQQFTQILDSWPLTGSTEMKELDFISGELTPPIFKSSKTDAAYISARTQFDTIANKISNLKKFYEKNLTKDCSFNIKINRKCPEIQQSAFFFYTSKHLTKFEKSVKDYKDVMEELKDFLKNLDTDSVSSQLTDSLHHLKTCSENVKRYEPWENISEKQKSDLEKKLSEKVENLIENILIGVQKLIKKYKNNEESEKENIKEEEVDFGELIDNHFDKKLVESLDSDFQDLNMNVIGDILSSVFSCLSNFSDNSDLTNSANGCLQILSTAVPFVRQYIHLCSYFVSQQKICYRTSNKLSSVLFCTFIQVAQKGYCAPPEYEDDDEGDGDGKGWNESEGGGFTGGEGDGQKDVSGRIESEDQLEDAKPQGSEKDKEQEKDCKEEEGGIEISEDFEGKTQDLDKNEDEEDDDNQDEEDETEMDKEMGETEAGADKLESELWSESEDEDGDNPDKKEEKGKGEQINKDQYAAKDGENDEDQTGDEDQNKERKQKQKDINEMEEPEDNGDQIDPYHGHHEPEVEPEPLDLPDNLQLDDGEMKGEEETQEGNPFDIDAMKEVQPPKPEDEKMEEDGGEGEKEEEKNEDDTDSEDEGKTDETKMEQMDVDEEGEDEEVKEEKEDGKKETGGGRKDDEEEERKEEEERINEDEFHPSDDKPSEMPAQPAPETKNNEQSSCDQVVGSEEDKQNEFQPQEISQQSDKEPKGVGQAELEQTKQSHDASSSKKEKLKSGQAKQERERKRERPGKSDEDRCLGDAESTVNKKLKTLDKLEEKEENEKEEGINNEESDLYQHVSEKVEEATQVLDAATKDQAESQSVPNKDDEEGEKPEEDEEIAMDVDEEEVNVEDIDKRKSEVDGSKSSKKTTDEDGDVLTEEVKKQIEGEVIKTMVVERGPETTFHTHLASLIEDRSLPLNPEEIQALRIQIQQQLSSFNQNEVAGLQSMQAWQMLTSVVDGLARDLSEQLRLILEPTQATRLKGDYRTGRRINMRKVISYVASEFRKDSIWLRRTKPWKREHEIVLAIDNSQSMCHNESKELAFESLALVFKALGFIEAGQLGVLSFGEKTKIVHRPGDPFADDTGARILQEFTFEQNKTLVCEMLDVSTSLMSSEKKKEDVARLLLIISDGRGVFSEGLERVKVAVRRATDSGIFVVFVIIDNPKSKDSIMDIRMPEFKDGKLAGIKSYMELFPFPYYLILRDIAALPNTLSDALRQWFQLITVNDN